MNKVIIGIGLIAIIAIAGFTSSQHAVQGYTVTITNLTKGQPFGKAIVLSHAADMQLYKIGEAATPELQALAEEGDNVPFSNKLKTVGQVLEVMVGDAAITPGASQTFTIHTDDTHPYISVAGMLGSTNDTFGAASFTLQKGTSIYYGEAYDAGTEANSEKCEFIPGPPCGKSGMHDPAAAEGMVSVSPGLKGNGDLDVSKLGWNGSVIKVEVQPVSQQ